MIEKIDTSKIRGEWVEYRDNQTFVGGNDTIQSIEMVADKLNEIIDHLNKSNDPTTN